LQGDSRWVVNALAL